MYLFLSFCWWLLIEKWIGHFAGFVLDIQVLASAHDKRLQWRSSTENDKLKRIKLMSPIHSDSIVSYQLTCRFRSHWCCTNRNSWRSTADRWPHRNYLSIFQCLDSIWLWPDPLDSWSPCSSRVPRSSPPAARMARRPRASWSLPAICRPPRDLAADRRTDGCVVSCSCGPLELAAAMSHACVAMNYAPICAQTHRHRCRQYRWPPHAPAFSAGTWTRPMFRWTFRICVSLLWCKCRKSIWPTVWISVLSISCRSVECIWNIWRGSGLVYCNECIRVFHHHCRRPCKCKWNGVLVMLRQLWCINECTYCDCSW